MQPGTWSLTTGVLVFVACAAAIALVGSRLTRTADRLADRTGIGEALAGAVLLGATTSLSGSVLSVTAAFNDRPELAMGNALGGIAVQKLFLAVADAFHPRANLEHAAASVSNLLQASLLVVLLGLLLASPYLPDVTIWQVHPLTPVMLGVYLGGLLLVRRGHVAPMWNPQRTDDTRSDVPDEASGQLSLPRLWTEFAAEAVLIGAAGWLLQGAAAAVSREAGISASTMGLLLTSTSTSLPELVTSVAAVRQGALTLAVGGIVGGNAFDTLFGAFSDVAYRGGSIYHTMPDDVRLWLAGSIAMTGMLLLGLVARQARGPARIGFESVAIIAIYVLLAGTVLFGA
ncbi:MAG: sodium:calcium antiporter [Vicinamibacterales bacterium]